MLKLTAVNEVPAPGRRVQRRGAPRVQIRRARAAGHGAGRPRFEQHCYHARVPQRGGVEQGLRVRKAVERDDLEGPLATFHCRSYHVDARLDQSDGRRDRSAVLDAARKSTPRYMMYAPRVLSVFFVG